MAATAGVWIALSILILIAIVIIIAAGIRIIQPHQKGLVEVLGSYRGILEPGFHLVPPMITRVTFLDMRLQQLNLENQVIVTKDDSLINVDLSFNVLITDPYKAYYKVQNYREASLRLAKSVLSGWVVNYNLKELLRQQEIIGVKMRDALNNATDAWGIEVSDVYFQKIEVVQRPDRSIIEQDIEYKTTPLVGGESLV